MVNKSSGFILIEIVFMLIIITLAVPLISQISNHQKRNATKLHNNYKKSIENINNIYQVLSKQDPTGIDDIKLCKKDTLYYACQ